MTLLKMVRDTVGFIFILTCYLFLVSSIFTTLFQGPEEEKYGSMSLSMRTMIDDMLANYETENIADSHNFSHAVLLIIHLVISCIFLLNYLIAILSSVFHSMKESGDFTYTATRYDYIEKYQVPQLDKCGYEELVLHPAPLNMFNVVLLPFVFSAKHMKSKADMFGARELDSSAPPQPSLLWFDPP
jgi:hypothetical protein